MTREEFQNMIHGLLGLHVDYNPITFKEIKKPREYLEIKWVIGGSSFYTEEEPSFTELDKILEKVCPQLTYILSKKLSKIFIIFQSTQHNYDGTYYISTIKQINIDDLWNFLTENNLIANN